MQSTIWKEAKYNYNENNDNFRVKKAMEQKDKWHMNNNKYAQYISLIKINKAMENMPILASFKAIEEFIDEHADDAFLYSINNVLTTKKMDKSYNVNLIAEELSDEQKKALKMALDYKYSMILGYAGTGKTTTITKLTKIIEPEDMIILAPTGKAAKVAKEKNPEIKCQTIHRFLGAYIPDLGKKKSYEYAGFAGNIRRYDLIIVDEISMVSHELIFQILKFCPKSQIIFVGDAGQIPPVNATSVIQTLKNKIPCSQLTKIYRTAEDSHIIDFATKLRNGENITNYNKINHDFEIIETSTLISDLFTHKWFSFNDIVTGNAIILTPFKNKDNGTVEINNTFENLFQDKLKNKSLVFNSTNEGLLVNGSTGVLLEQKIKYSSNTNREYVSDALVNFIDEGMLHLVGKQCWNLEKAYCLTIHKSQGSEFNTVFVVIPNNAKFMLKDVRLLYTAITRAKKRCVLLVNSMQIFQKEINIDI